MKSALGLFAAVSLNALLFANHSLAAKMTPEEARKDAIINCTVQEDEDLLFSEINLVPLSLMEDEITLTEESFSFLDSTTIGLRQVTPAGVLSDVCERIEDKVADYRFKCPLGQKGVDMNGYLEIIVSNKKDIDGNPLSKVHLHLNNESLNFLHLVSPMTCVYAAQ